MDRPASRSLPPVQLYTAGPRTARCKLPSFWDCKTHPARARSACTRGCRAAGGQLPRLQADEVRRTGACCCCVPAEGLEWGRRATRLAPLVSLHTARWGCCGVSCTRPRRLHCEAPTVGSPHAQRLHLLAPVAVLPALVPCWSRTVETVVQELARHVSSAPAAYCLSCNPCLIGAQTPADAPPGGVSAQGVSGAAHTCSTAWQSGGCAAALPETAVVADSLAPPGAQVVRGSCCEQPAARAPRALGHRPACSPRSVRVREGAARCWPCSSTVGGAVRERALRCRPPPWEAAAHRRTDSLRDRLAAAESPPRGAPTRLGSGPLPVLAASADGSRFAAAVMLGCLAEPPACCNQVKQRCCSKEPAAAGGAAQPGRPRLLRRAGGMREWGPRHSQRCTNSLQSRQVLY